MWFSSLVNKYISGSNTFILCVNLVSASTIGSFAASAVTHARIVFDNMANVTLEEWKLTEKRKATMLYEWWDSQDEDATSQSQFAEHMWTYSHVEKIRTRQTCPLFWGPNESVGANKQKKVQVKKFITANWNYEQNKPIVVSTSDASGPKEKEDVSNHCDH